MCQIEDSEKNNAMKLLEISKPTFLWMKSKITKAIVRISNTSINSANMPNIQGAHVEVNEISPSTVDLTTVNYDPCDESSKSSIFLNPIFEVRESNKNRNYCNLTKINKSLIQIKQEL